MSYIVKHTTQSERLNVPWLFTVLLAGFVFCYTVGPRVPVLALVARLLGAVMAGCVVVRWIKTGVQIPLEIGILSVFVLWAVGAGGLLAIDTALYQEGAERLLEILLLAGCVAAMAVKCRTPAMGLFAITGVALIFAGYSLITGGFARAEEFTQVGDRVIGHRASSLAYNPNTLGVFCAWGLAGLALLWRKAKRIWHYALLICLALLLLAGAVFSGSLKAVVLVPLFLLAWAWFCYRQLLFRRMAVFLAAGSVAAAIIVGASFVLRDTYSGARLQAVFSAENSDPSTDLRLSMIREGIRTVAEHPFAGVGLWQFAALSTHHVYAHNDYVEVAATTGLIGLAIYCSVFVLTAWRLVQVRRRSHNPEVCYVAGLCLAVLVTCGAAAFALVSSCSIEFWCFISGVLGFASVAGRDVVKHSVRPGRNYGSLRPRDAFRNYLCDAHRIPPPLRPVTLRRPKLVTRRPRQFQRNLC